MLNDLDRMGTELAYVEAGLRAQAEGFDAIMIGPVADYGMRQLRSVVSIPVVGAGQSSMQVAAGLGRRFAIVTVWPEILRPAYERQLVDYGFAGHRSDEHTSELQSLMRISYAVFCLKKKKKAQKKHMI